MQDAILNFPKQFHWRPKIENGPLKKYKKFVVAGMGGSHLAGDIIKSLRPELDIVVHSDYGLPIGLPPFLIPSTSLRADKEGEKGEFSSPTPSSSPPRAGGENKRSQRRGVLVIASSYSGNTEETIDAFEKAVAENLPVAAIAIGGKLLELAKKHSVPYIQLPDTGIQPRSALGFSMMAMLKLMKQNELLKAARELSQIVRPHNLEQSGKTLAERLKNFVPVIYSSTRNAAVAYNWKIKLNETGKIPAFYNIFPELNHNEMTGFSAAGGPLPDRQAGLTKEGVIAIKMKNELPHRKRCGNSFGQQKLSPCPGVDKIARMCYSVSVIKTASWRAEE